MLLGSQISQTFQRILDASPSFSSPTGRRLQLEEGIHILLQVSVPCCVLFINNHQSSCDRRPEIYEADLSPVLPR